MTSPKFRVDRTVRPPKAYLQCSHKDCDKDIREILPQEEISVTRAYYCEEHDSNVIDLNLPVSES